MLWLIHRPRAVIAQVHDRAAWQGSFFWHTKWCNAEKNTVYSMQIHTENMENLFSSLQVKDTSIGWSLGYMLSMSNMIPSEMKEINPMTDPVFAGLIFLFSALTIITVVIVFIILVRTCYWECKLQREWFAIVSLGGCCNPVSSTTVACAKTLVLKVTVNVLFFFQFEPFTALYFNYYSFWKLK